jgi:hypothetical protein
VTILVGLVVALAGLYWWLLGHWFARIVCFLVLAPVMGLIWAALAGRDVAGHLMIGIVVMAFAWPLSGLPTYFWRWHYKRTYGEGLSLRL